MRDERRLTPSAVMLALAVLPQHAEHPGLFEQLIAPIADENVEHARVIAKHGSVLSGRKRAGRVNGMNGMRDRDPPEFTQ
jgi:hypothetical protein